MSQAPWRRQIKSVLRSVGYDFIRFVPESSDGAKQHAVLRHLQTDLVLDVGANEGQYGQLLRSFGYRGRILSFEPLTSAYGKLLSTAAGDAAWAVHPRTAIGDHDGSITIHIAGNNVSSSVLPMLDRHLQAAAESRYIGSEVVPLACLNTVLPAARGDARSIFLKIDTQGYEAAVLRGADQVLHLCRGVQLEMSLLPLYDGQELWTYFLAEFERRGFALWTILPGFVEETTGRTMQIDAIFVKD